MIVYRPEGRGSPLISMLVFILLLLGLGLGTLYWVGSRARPRAARAAAKTAASHAAQAGIARGRRLLARARDWNRLLKGTPCRAPLVSGKGRVLCDGKTPLLDQRTRTIGPRGRASQRVAFSIFLRNDDDEAMHTGQRDEDGKVIIRCEARGRGRSGQVSLEVVLSQPQRRVVGPADYAQASFDAAGSNALWLP